MKRTSNQLRQIANGMDMVILAAMYAKLNHLFNGNEKGTIFKALPINKI